MGKVRRGANKSQTKKKKGSAQTKSSGVIKRTSVVKPKAAGAGSKQGTKKYKPARVAHQHHSKEPLFAPEPSAPLVLAAED
jgi:hypothetical protein